MNKNKYAYLNNSAKSTGSEWEMMYLRRIIIRMLEFAKRWGPYFLGAFVVLLGGAIQTWIFFKDYRVLATVILLILSVFCFIATIVALVYDFRNARKKDKKEYDRTHGKFHDWR